MADSLTVTGVALNTNEPSPCAPVVNVTDTVTGTTVCGHNFYTCQLAAGYTPGAVTGTAIYGHDFYRCPSALGVTRTLLLDGLLTEDIVYSVWWEGAPLTLDNATVGWVAADVHGTPIITKTTGDYSIIAFGNTLIVHLAAGEAAPNQTLYCTVTITTADSSVYTMAEQFITEAITGAAAIYTYEKLPCTTASEVVISSITGLHFVGYECEGCPQTLGVSPNARSDERADIDLVYTVWSTNGPLTLDNATVEWVAEDNEGTPLITKTTDDYSIITFGSTLIVHIDAGDFPRSSEIMYYTATITLGDTYTMTGLLEFFPPGIIHPVHPCARGL